jgi:toxin ParE1/3/4
VSVVRYSVEADQDLADIAEYTRTQWGDSQAAAYITLLERTCERIIPQNLGFARKAARRPKLLRWRCERHVIYFRRDAGDIEIVRVLHERMLPTLHL